MRKAKKNLLCLVVFVITAFAIVFGAIIINNKELNREDNNNGIANRLEVNSQYVNQSGFNDWMNNPTSNITLTQNVTYNGRISNKEISGTLDGNGYSINLTGSGGAWIADDVGGTHGDPLRGVFSKSISGTIRNVKFIYSGSITMNLDNSMQWDNGETYIGFITGRLTNSGLIDNCSFSLNSNYSLKKEGPSTSASYKDTWMFAGLLAGELNGTIRNCNINLNSEFRFDGTGSAWNNGKNDVAYIATAVGCNNGGQLLNTTINVGDNAYLYSDSEKGEYAAGVIAYNKATNSIVDGVIINNVSKFANSIFAYDGQDYLIVSNYDAGTIKNIYVDSDATNIQCNTGGKHSTHSYGLGRGTKTLDFNVNVFGTNKAYFKAGDSNNVYFDNPASSNIIWSINGTDVYRTYNTDTTTITIQKSNATNSQIVFNYTKGSVLEGNLTVEFNSTTLTYGQDLRVIARYNGDLINIDSADYSTNCILNDYGVLDVGTYSISLNGSKVYDLDNRVIYRNPSLNSSTATVTPKEIVMEASSVDLYSASVRAIGLIGNERLTFDVYDNISVGGNATVVPSKYIDSNIALIFLKSNITNKNYSFNQDSFSFDIKSKNIDADSRISINGDVDGASIDNLDGECKLILTKPLSSISLLATSSKYGTKITEITGAVNNNASATNSTYTADIALTNDVTELGITEVNRTVTMTAESNNAEYGSVSVDKANPTIGESVVYTATATEGYVFLGWTEDGKYVSFDAIYNTIAGTQDKALVAVFADKCNVVIMNGDREVGKLSLTTEQLANLVLGETISAEEANLGDAAINAVDKQAYNDFYGWRVDSISEDGVYTLKAIYADAIKTVEVSIDGVVKNYAINSDIVLSAGNYTVNGVAITVDSVTTLKALAVLTIVTNGEATAEASATGVYDADKEVLQINAIMAVNAKLSIEIVNTTINDSIMANAIKGRLVANISGSNKIIQAIVTVDREFLAYAEGRIEANVYADGELIGTIVVREA